MHIASWENVRPPGLGLGGSGGSATRDSVVDSFPTVQRQWEGYEPEMYTDSIGLVTTGIGNKIDDGDATHASGMDGYGPALKLPWVHKSDGKPATQAEIIQDWQTVKAAHKASGSYDAPTDRKITQLKLSDLAIQDLVASQLITNEHDLVKSLPGFASFPADAQMVIHGMAWAMGGGFIPADGFHTFAAAANNQNWPAAKAASAFRGAAPQRKAGHDLMFDNAARVRASNASYDTLWYPRVAPATALGGALAVAKKPVVVVATLLGLVAIGGGIYVATRPVGALRRVPSL